MSLGIVLIAMAVAMLVSIFFHVQGHPWWMTLLSYPVTGTVVSLVLPYLVSMMEDIKRHQKDRA